MRRKIAFSVLGFILTFFCVGGAYSAEKVITLEFSSILPIQNPISAEFIDWCKTIEKRTNGRVKINYHPIGALVPPNQTLDAVAKGVADIGWANLGYNPGRYPLSEVMDLPLGCRSATECTRLANAFYAKFKPKELDGLHILWFQDTNPLYFHTKKPVKTLDDLQGLKVRCSGGGGIGAVKAFGGVPVALQVADTYDALSKGVVGGALFSSEALEMFKWKDVVQYTTMNRRSSISTNGPVAMNKKKYESLPPDIKKIFDEEAARGGDKISKVMDRECDGTVAKLKGEKNHKFIELSKEEEERWFKKTRPLFEQYVKEKSAKGLPAAQALEFCRGWLEKNQK